MIPKPLERFVERFNRGQYWESHEVLEDLWRERDSDFLQGLILYASAFVHVRRGNRHGIEAQLSKAETKLMAYQPAYLGIDVAGTLAHIRTCRDIVQRNPAAEPERWSSLVPFPRLEIKGELVRGDEPELTRRQEPGPVDP